MKLAQRPNTPAGSLMPPTRGHDLKHERCGPVHGRTGMPPTRGHDLKLLLRRAALDCAGCPPHGGTT